MERTVPFEIAASISSISHSSIFKGWVWGRCLKFSLGFLGIWMREGGEARGVVVAV